MAAVPSSPCHLPPSCMHHHQPSLPCEIYHHRRYHSNSGGFLAAAAAVAGCGWRIGHHRRGEDQKNSDLLPIFPCMVVTSSVKAIFKFVVDFGLFWSIRGCPPPNHHRGGSRTIVQPPQPHHVVSGYGGATPKGASLCSAV
nr:hypothetical protein [Tanacetum cinerariifolium]